MGYYVSTMIGIRTGGVFGGDVDMDDLRPRVLKIVQELDADIPDNLECMSNELHAHKGSYVVIAGVFNYWTFDKSSEFAKRLSEEFGVEVMIMSWDEEKYTIQTQIYLDGSPLFDVEENPIGKVLRRIG
jgi:hypothetical protein